jgi:hypothetical protein
MALTKYASFEVSEILGVRGAVDQQRLASLDKFADYKDYRTDDGYLYARIIAISSRVNKNNDGWPSVELAGGQKFWDERVAPGLEKSGSVVLETDPNMKTGYSTFPNKPIFVDHNNSDTKRARGVIADAKLRVKDHRQAKLDSYYASEDVDDEHLPPTQVELLLEIDAKSFPKLAQAIVEGSKDSSKGIDGFSMGCDVEKSKCSHCGNEASSPREYCSHIKMKGAEHKVTSGKHAGKSRKSYENCYGVKFFEISAVFDPADETALLQELIDENPNHESKIAAVDDVVQKPCPQCQGTGVLDGDTCTLCEGTGKSGEVQYALQQGTDGTMLLPPGPEYGKPTQIPGMHFTEGPEFLHADQSIQAPHFNVNPNSALLQQLRQKVKMNNPYMSRREGSYLQHKTADNPLPQFMHPQSPPEVDTLRTEKICPVCGEQMEGEKCATCGHIEAPEGFNNPNLDAARNNESLTTPDMPGVGQDEAPNSEQNTPLDGAPDPGTASAVSYLQSRKRAITPGVTSAAAVTAGKIKTQERPLKPGQVPVTDEPQESVVSDQDRPVTSTFRTAMDLIRAATSNQGSNMGNNKIAAEAPSGVGAQKRVDVEGVGGVIDANNEAASKPDGSRSFENAGTTVDVTGKGGVIEDSNLEASKPSKGTENLPTAGRDSDDAGFNKDKTTDDSGPTKTFDNSNEPSSAVTDKVFTGAKQGVKPIGGSDVQPQRRENVEQDSGFSNPQKGTDQWTGTSGNGVTRQQDPVTKKVDPNIDAGKKASAFAHVVAAMKLADAEIAIGVLDADKKYDRVAELESLTPEELAAEERVISRVKTAGLAKKTATRREAATREGEVSGRLPSFGKKAGELQPKQAQVIDDTLGDSALFMR